MHRVICAPEIEPDLRFGPGTNQGFTGVGVATFDDLKPSTVVRELIQNALDAARTAESLPAKVRFSLSVAKQEDIPGIEGYKTVFEKAVNHSAQLASQAQLVVDRIRQTLAKDSVDILTISDNGVGLDQKRMDALLGDGISEKGLNATGTYGNGHATAIPTSDLRYVLYGGITKGGNRIGSGHAVLASHREHGCKHVQSGDGFFIREFTANTGSPYSYATGSGLPELIKRSVDEIKDESGHGTAVIIPAFNHFSEQSPLWDMVAHAASANFFVAIADGQLEVSVEDRRPKRDCKPISLDKSTLEKVLKQFSVKRRGQSFSGHRAYHAYHAYKRGKRHTINTSQGEIQISILDNPSDTVRIDLFRNGMWITDEKKIPGFYQKFNKKVPFHAVLSLRAEGGGNLHNLISKSEGPLHNSIVLKNLPANEQKECRKALRNIKDWILDNLKDDTSDEYVSDDYLSFDFGDQFSKGKGKGRRNYCGAPVIKSKKRSARLSAIEDVGSHVGTERGLGKGDNGGNDGNEKKKRGRSRPVLPEFFKVASCPIGPNRFRLLIDCSKNYENAEVRLTVDEAVDETCERIIDQYVPAELFNVTISGRSVRECDLVRWDQQVIGIKLGDLKAGNSIEIETDFRLTGDFSNLPNPSLRVEIFKGNKSTSSEQD